MRIWGNKVDALHIASGTIFNEVIIWKVVCQNCATLAPMSEHVTLANDKNLLLDNQLFEASNICRLVGHEGSIFRIAWSSDGSKLVSVSDDRCARIWSLNTERKSLGTGTGESVSYLPGLVLYGHSARVWDCFVDNSSIITAGEDCTCRVWGLDGCLQRMIKEHIGRGVWRCLYDPKTFLLVTAGFDSSIKVHQMDFALSKGSKACIENIEDHIGRTVMFSCRIPHSSEHFGHMDSKSEYVRSLHFARKDCIYVATNNGFLYHAKILDNGDVKWTELIRVSEEVPIVCMNLCTENPSNLSCGIEDWVAVGDGKGRVTVVKIIGDVFAPKVELTFAWSAEMERQLLGTYWCKSLGSRFIFTTDPRGKLRLWRLYDTSQPESCSSMSRYKVSLVAEFVSCFRLRLMCLDVSFEEEVIVCGDLRGNLILFPLSKHLLLDTIDVLGTNTSPLSYFKGAHGISSVCSVTVTSYGFNQIEVQSSGGDGCICYFEYERTRQNLEFIGLKQVKEISLVHSVVPTDYSCDSLARGNYAVGFASSDFIIWNIVSETKVIQVACGGWRRPYSFYLGDVPEMKNCFAFVKDEVIYIHRCWVPDLYWNKYPRNLHLQFHGREMHTLCFISEDSNFSLKEKHKLSSKSTWIVTGCEDGTVRLTRYAMDAEHWSASELLGEHVGGSSVRSICFVSKVHIVEAESTNIPNGVHRQIMTLEDQVNPSLLISVGAKRVLTAWKQKITTRKRKDEALCSSPAIGTINESDSLSEGFSAMSFQWLSTDMPIRNNSIHRKGEHTVKGEDADENVIEMSFDETSGSASVKSEKANSRQCFVDKSDDDWRYLAVTAFLVKFSDSRVSVCFIIVACSDATLALRALILPYRLWFDVALFVSLSSPVLSLQHIIVPKKQPGGEMQDGNLYIVISGSTDGSIAFWDMTEAVEAFMLRVSALEMDNHIDCQRRPQTGRGSQGGRWWRSLGSHSSKEKPVCNSILATTVEGKNMQSDVVHKSSALAPKSATACIQSKHPASLESEVKTNDFPLNICKILPIHVLNNVHQSGVNCIHVSEIKHFDVSNLSFMYYVLSGGDDQSLTCHGFEVALSPSIQQSENSTSEMHDTSFERRVYQFRNKNNLIRFLSFNKIMSAHSSAIKGIWTDGKWAFSTGLDQRVRCWKLEQNGKLVENAHLIISVPEPEALGARVCDENYYQIAVAGRGMQMVQFFAPGGLNNEESGASV